MPRICYQPKMVRGDSLGRILEDGMRIPKVRQALKRDFMLDFSEGFIYDCLHRKVR